MAMWSLPRSSTRCLTKVCAHGWISSGLRSAVMLAPYLAEILSHTPERSGFPSAVRGAGAVRFGLPPEVRGMPGVGRFSHCAFKKVTGADNRIATTRVLMFYLL